VSPSWPHRSPDIAFTNSRPGSWVAASVSVGSEKIACVSLYGLLEELGDASMHRSLSEISPLFSDPRHEGLVLLGGDFNTSTATDVEHRERDRIVLDRVKAYGLRDCLAEWREKNDLPPLVGCRCDDEPCRHTLTRLTPNKEGEERPWQERVSKQVDYLFASGALADRLDGVVEIEPEEWETYSDHRPIIVMFRAEERQDGSSR
jgi:endonuclease/exonuclease/phosphatase (EEP) superfamily protein YafD